MTIDQLHEIAKVCNRSGARAELTPLGLVLVMRRHMDDHISRSTGDVINYGLLNIGNPVETVRLAVDRLTDELNDMENTL